MALAASVAFLVAGCGGSPVAHHHLQPVSSTQFTHDFHAAYSTYVSDAAIVREGRAVCSARASGSSQATVVQDNLNNWGTDNTARLVRLSERDLCPQYLSSSPISAQASASPGPSAGDKAVCAAWKKDVTNAQVINTLDLQQALFSATGVSPRLRNDVTAYLAATTLHRIIKAQIKVIIDCSLIDHGVPLR
jgi:hypothetical protein